jgi:transcriptional regulator with XRE-family HTH domain
MNVRDRRRELGYDSQAKFAEKFGFSIGTVSAVENHYTLFGNMSSARREKWAKALQCTVGELLESDASRLKTKSVFPVKTHRMGKAKLELYLKAKCGDKIGKVKAEKTTSLLSREYTDYEKENRWVNLEDTRMNHWGY